MPRVALAICLLWFLSLFVFRSVVQWRRTGSTGMKGFHGRVGSLPWVAGVAASLGLALSPAAPLGVLLGWPGATLLLEAPSLHVLGAVLALVGTLGALAAQLSMGDSWRIGVDDAETTRLVTDGLFAWVRNPIFSFMTLSVVGLVLLVPCALSLAAAGLTILGIELQVRGVEEPYLLKTHGEEYAQYVGTVGRFVPGVGRQVRRSRPAHQ